MAVLVSIDPGLNYCGVGLWLDGSLWAAGLPVSVVTYEYQPKRGGPAAWVAMTQGVLGWLNMYLPDFETRTAALVIEVPRVYQGSKQKGDPNDLIDLAGVAGSICSARHWLAISRYYPHEWKGQVPKTVMEARIKARLSAAELARPTDHGARMHNVWDAVGIGLNHLGRLRR